MMNENENENEMKGYPCRGARHNTTATIYLTRESTPCHVMASPGGANGEMLVHGKESLGHSL